MRKIEIPLLKDHHTHPSVYSAMAGCLDLRGIPTPQDALRLMRARTDSPCLVLGWNNGLFTFSKRELESLPATFILNTSLHTFLQNSAATRMLAETHPEIVRNAKNEGWIERNLASIFKMIVDLRGCDESSLSNYYSNLAEQGVWYAEEMLLPNAKVLRAIRKGGLTGRTACWADPATYLSFSTEERASVQGIKLFADGALGAQTAAMSRPYSNSRGGLGMLLRSQTQLVELLTELASWRKELAVHAIGERAIDQVIDSLETLAGLTFFPQVRLEHCQFISPNSARRARDLGIKLCMQPNFSLDSVMYRDRLTVQQIRENNPFRMLIDDVRFEPGNNLIFGSDGMPHGAQTALDSALFPPQPGQVLSLDEFVAGYCWPDLAPGSIEVQVDHRERCVRIEGVRLNPAA